jgi:hypothetical protein
VDAAVGGGTRGDPYRPSADLDTGVISGVASSSQRAAIAGRSVPMRSTPRSRSACHASGRSGAP